MLYATLTIAVVTTRVLVSAKLILKEFVIYRYSKIR